jgi:hypothetical protein
MSIDVDGPMIPSPDGVYELVSPLNGNDIAIPVIILCAVPSVIFYILRLYVKFATRRFNSADLSYPTSEIILARLYRFMCYYI